MKSEPIAWLAFLWIAGYLIYIKWQVWAIKINVSRLCRNYGVETLEQEEAREEQEARQLKEHPPERSEP